MGLFGDSNEETKEIDATGNVNNNLIIDQSVPIHNEHLTVLLYIITTIKVIEFFYILFKAYNKRQKKKYVQRSLNSRNANL